MFQLPGGPSTLSQMVSTVPPLAGTRRSFPSAMNAIDVPSGDQKGARAPLVPGSGCADVSSSRRTHNTTVPVESGAMNARRRPSPEIAMRSAGAPGSGAGGTISVRWTRGVGTGGRLTT